MEIQKSVKVRIYPRESDKVLLAKHFGVRRWIYNKFLDIRRHEYLENKKSISYNSCSAIVTAMKKTEEFEWLKEVNSQTIQQALMDLDTSYQRFFKKVSKFPRFKCKHDDRQSFKVPQHFIVDFESGLLKIPKFKTPFKFSGKYSGTLTKVNSVTISMDKTGKYFASIQGLFEIDQYVRADKTIGVDLGLKSFLVTNEGDVTENPRFLKNSLKKLKFQQRQHSKSKKDSSRRERKRNKLARQYQKVTNKRNNFLHQVSTQLIRDNQTICLEDLAIKNMVKNHNLSQAISDVSWGAFVSMIKYKAAWHGREVVQIDRWYPSSKTCSDCNYLLPSLELKVREWACPDCGSNHDRDINAARNILKQGLNILSGLGIKSDVKQKSVEALTLVESMKQENTLS